MNLILCIAGLNTRFHDVGFDIPKYLLPWNNTTIISEIITQLSYGYDFDEIIILANSRDKYFKNNLYSTLENVPNKHIYYIADTLGQAHTAMVGASLLKYKNKPIAIMNGDTILKGRNFFDIEKFAIKNDAYVDVFISNNQKYSYVKSDSNGYVQQIVEKIPISPFASSGLYCFKSSEFYMEQFNETVEMSQNSEIYVSNILSNMISAKKFDIYSNGLDNNHKTIVLGSPYEYGIEFAKLMVTT
jgi:dTDP-glucose pyrophosphorylase